MKKMLLTLFGILLYSVVPAQVTVSDLVGDGFTGFMPGFSIYARIGGPFGMCLDRHGDLFIAVNPSHLIARVSGDSLYIFAGNGVAGLRDTTALQAQFRAPSDVAVDDSGNVYVSDFENHVIRRIGANGWVTTLAGTATQGYTDGPALSAQFRYPRGIAWDPAGYIYVSDSWNHRIRKIAGGSVSTHSGSGTAFGVGTANGYADGSAQQAMFATPCGLSIDTLGNLYLADAYNHRLRRIAPDGSVTTLAGSGPTGNGQGGFADGAAASSVLNTPTECTWHAATGDLWFSDTFNQRIRTLSGGQVITQAGTGATGAANGPGPFATFNTPRGIAINPAGDSIWVSDFGNNEIRLLRTNVTGSAPTVLHTLQLYPNPVQDVLRVEWEGCGKWEIRNAAGTPVLNGEGCNLFTSIDITALPAGAYVFSLRTDLERKSSLFTVQH